MNKYLKIALYILLIVVIIVVIFLMLWSPKDVNIEYEIDSANLTWENNEESIENVENIVVSDNKSDSFEEDVMKDLEWFFNNNNWYEDVEWEFWFTNPDNE